jgi:hypothetical protein
MLKLFIGMSSRRKNITVPEHAPENGTGPRIKEEPLSKELSWVVILLLSDDT